MPVPARAVLAPLTRLPRGVLSRWTKRRPDGGRPRRAGWLPGGPVPDPHAGGRHAASGGAPQLQGRDGRARNDREGGRHRGPLRRCALTTTATRRMIIAAVVVMLRSLARVRQARVPPQCARWR
eukprot:scaffold2348_cov341-Prasinococcus_capsulatus_cf.AAC.5